MDALDKRIGERLRRITHADDKTRFPVMSGVVKSVDAGEMTAVVVMSMDDADAPTEEVTLNVITQNTNGVSMIPAVGAHCLVAEVDGPGKWEVLKASSYTKITMKVGAAEVSVDGVTGKFVVKNAGADLGTVLKDYVQHTMQITVATGAGTSSVPLNISDFAADLAKLGLLF
jgi:hypothetical protein